MYSISIAHALYHSFSRLAYSMFYRSTTKSAKFAPTGSQVLSHALCLGCPFKRKLMYQAIASL